MPHHNRIAPSHAVGWDGDRLYHIVYRTWSIKTSGDNAPGKVLS